MELDISVKVSQLHEIISNMSTDEMEYAYLEISETDSGKYLNLRAAKSKAAAEDKSYGVIKAVPELQP